MNRFIENINKLPQEVIAIIEQYTPKKALVFTNKENYFMYHRLIRSSITHYENYIRDAIKRDNEFVFQTILRENYSRWSEIKNYRYKNKVFKTYVYFILSFCAENDSNNCRKVINEYFVEHGLGKNLHKKNILKYI